MVQRIRNNLMYGGMRCVLKNAFYLNQFICLTVFRCTSNCRLDFKPNAPHQLFTLPREVAMSKERLLGYFSKSNDKERFLADFLGWNYIIF